MTDPAPTSPTLSDWVQRSFAGLIFMACLYLTSTNATDADLWGHVQYGRDAIANGALPSTTTYSFTTEGYRWINHEVLSELTLATVFDHFGNAGLLFGKLLLAALVLGLIFRAARSAGMQLLHAAMFLFLIATNLEAHWCFRPQTASFVCFALLLWLLDYCFAHWYATKSPPTDALESGFLRRTLSAGEFAESRRLRYLWLAPVILFFWANSHGAFVAGLCVYGAFLVGRSLESIAIHRGQSKPIVVWLAMLAIAGVCATLVNPYGFQLHHWLLQSLVPRPEIVDWTPTDLTNQHGLRLLMLVAAALFCVAATRPKFQRKDWVKLGIIALVGWQSFEHVRHIPFFALLCGFWLPPYVAATLQRFASHRSVAASSESPIATRWAAVVSVAGWLIFAAACPARLSDVQVSKSEYPVAAFQYIADQRLSGKMMVTFDWAQYAIGAFGKPTEGLPHCPVSIDGRFRTCYPQEVIDMHFDFLIGDAGEGSRNRAESSGAIDGSKILEYGKPDLVVIHNGGVAPQRVMESQRDNWALLYQDSLAQVWGRATKYGDPESDDFIAESERHVGFEPQLGYASWPAIPSPVVSP